MPAPPTSERTPRAQVLRAQHLRLLPGRAVIAAAVVVLAACRPPEPAPEPPVRRSAVDAPRCSVTPLAEVPLLEVPATMRADELVRALHDRPAGTPVRLDLSGQRRGDAFVIALVEGLRSAKVRALGLAGNELGPAAMGALATAPGLGCLERLDIGKNPVTDHGFASLCTASTARDLRELVLNDAGLTGESLAMLGGCVWTTGLRELVLADNHFGDAAEAAGADPSTGPRAAPRASPGLLRMDLSRAHCRVPCLTLLRDSGLLHRLHALRLEGFFGPAEARILAGAKAPERLATLQLYGMVDLSEDPGDVLGDAGLRILVSSPMFAHIQQLALPMHDIGDHGIAALAASPHSSNLKQLDLRGNRIGDAGAQALMAGAHTRGLMHLDLSGTLISQEMAGALRAHYGQSVHLGQ